MKIKKLYARVYSVYLYTINNCVRPESFEDRRETVWATRIYPGCGVSGRWGGNRAGRTEEDRAIRMYAFCMARLSAPAAIFVGST